jgi:hypothetical protein
MTNYFPPNLGGTTYYFLTAKKYCKNSWYKTLLSSTENTSRMRHKNNDPFGEYRVPRRKWDVK